MASLTPGTLSKLLSGDSRRHTHRSDLLQVIEIVPSLSDDPFLAKTRAFFLKLSDSANSAYVLVSDQNDVDLVQNNVVQLGQFVHVAGIEPATPVPILRGLKPVPKSLRKPCSCVGNPVELVSSEALFQKKSDKRRLSLDSHRRVWDFNPNSLLVSSLVISEKEASPKNVSSSKQSNYIISPLKSKNGTPSAPLPKKKSLIRESKSSTEKAVSSGSGPKISWDTLPLSITELGKKAEQRRSVAFSASVNSLEEASAADGVVRCLCVFAELCNSSKKSPAGSVVQKFLDLNPKMLTASKFVESLLNSTRPDADSKNRSPQKPSLTKASEALSSKNSALWVKAALRTDLSSFNLFKKPSNEKIANEEETHHYVILQNPRKELDLEKKILVKNCSSPATKPDKKIKRTLFPGSTAKRAPPAPCAKSGSNGSSLSDAAVLSEELLASSREWFLTYLEKLLNRGFVLGREQQSSEVVSLLAQLKRVDQWLDGLVISRTREVKRVDGLRKKLYGFLLEHVDYALVNGKK